MSHVAVTRPRRFGTTVLALLSLVLGLVIAVTPTPTAHAADTATITGTVTLPAGAPTAWLTAVSVSASSNDGGWGWATVASDGTYTITGLTSGDYRVQFSAGGYWDDATQTEVRPNLVSEYYNDTTDYSKATLVTVAAGATKTGINATLAQGAAISGKITLPTDAPTDWMRGVSVSASAVGGGSSYGNGSVNADGTYTITGLAAGDYRVDFSASSYWDDATQTNVQPNLIREYYNDTTDYSKATLVTVAAGATKTGINATLAQGAAISGKITLPTDAPTDWMRGVSVSASAVGGGSSYGNGSVNADGTYTITGLAAGDYRVDFSASSYWDDATQTNVQPNLIREYYNDTTEYSKATLVTVSAGATKTSINATLAKGASISGKITLPTGAPAKWLAGIRVNATPVSGGTSYSSLTVNADGTYKISGIPGGDYRIQFSAGSYWDDATQTSVKPDLISEYYNDTTVYATATPVTVAAGGNKTSVNATLAKGASISGKVTLPSGAPTPWMKAVSVFANPVDGGSGAGFSTVNADGTYTITGLAAGDYRVQFSASSYWDDATQSSVPVNLLSEWYNDTIDYDKAAPVTVTAGGSKSGINATLARGASITGTVTLPTGAPASWTKGVSVYAYSASNESYSGYAQVGASGAYSVVGLPAGDYIVSFGWTSFFDNGVEVFPNLIGEYYNDTTVKAGATPVSLATGGTKSEVNAALALGSIVSGKIALPGGTTWASLSTVGEDLPTWTDVAEDGTFTMYGLTAGPHYLNLTSSTGTATDSQVLKRNATSYQFTAPSASLNVATQQTTASIGGSLGATGFTSPSGTAPLGETRLYQKVDTGWLELPDVGGAISVTKNGTKNYTLPGLTAGTYTVGFEKSHTPYSGVPEITAQWWQQKSTLASADPITLTAGQAKTGVTGTVTPKAGAIAFSDVSSTPGSSTFSQFAKEISWMATKGITTGYDVGGQREYRPFGTVTRDAMAAFLYRYAGSPAFTPPATSPFVDVPTSSTFYKEITWLASTRVTTGWDVAGGKKEFRPFANITRDAMAAFLYRYAKSPTYTAPATSPFVDVPTTGAFYKEITWLASTGITTGWDVAGGKKEFRPFANITRDAMAAFLYRYDQLPR